MPESPFGGKTFPETLPEPALEKSVPLTPG